MKGSTKQKSKCPKCGSSKVVAVHPFDYIKMCMNDDCPYRKTEQAKKNNWRYQWPGSEHN